MLQYCTIIPHFCFVIPKSTVESIPSGEKAPRVDVSDVVSSVKTIMASRMAELDQEAKPVYVDAQQLSGTAHLIAN